MEKRFLDGNLSFICLIGMNLLLNGRYIEEGEFYFEDKVKCHSKNCVKY